MLGVEDVSLDDWQSPLGTACPVDLGCERCKKQYHVLDMSVLEDMLPSIPGELSEVGVQPGLVSLQCLLILSGNTLESLQSVETFCL